MRSLLRAPDLPARTRRFAVQDFNVCQDQHAAVLAGERPKRPLKIRVEVAEIAKAVEESISLMPGAYAADLRSTREPGDARPLGRIPAAKLGRLRAGRVYRRNT